MDTPKAAVMVGRFHTDWLEGRGDQARDRCMLNDLKERFTESGYDVRELVVAFVTHESFGYRLAEDVE